jgi:outer membrane usher protein
MTSPASTYLAVLLITAAVSAVSGAPAYADAASVPTKAVQRALKAAEADEMWLAVALNGQVTGTTALVRYDHAGNLWVGEEELRNWRLPVSGQPDTSLPGAAFYPLQSFKGLAFKVDEESQTLTVDAPAHLFEHVHIDAASSAARANEAATAPGAFFNYDIVGAKDSDGFQSSGLLEAGTFGRFGTAVTRFLERKQTLGSSSVRLDTTWTIDRPEALMSVRVGDAITGASGWWGGAVRFGGVQWASNFATQPGLVTMPLASIAGESALPSTLELYVNDALRMKQNVPSGPFTVNDVPVVSGNGQIRVVVRDMLGREQVITQPYYSSPRLLRQGLHAFSIEAGAARDSYGLASNDYGRLLIVGTERYGFSNHLTGEIHAEILEEQQTLGLAAGLLVKGIGVLSLSAAGSRSDAGSGTLAALGLERTSGRFSIGFNGELASETFQRIGLLPNERVPRLKGQLFSNVALGRAGSFSVMSARQQYYGGDVRDIMSVRHGVNVHGLGYFGLSAVRIVGNRERDTSYSLTFSRPLGRLGSSSMGMKSNDEGLSGYAQVQRSMPAGTGFGYRLRARAGDVQGAQGAISYQGPVGTYSLEAETIEGAMQTRASVSGGLAVMGAGFFPTRRIDSSFAIARVGEEPNVRVYRDNQLVARTNAQGYAILPGLRAYEENQVTIEQSDLPLDAAVSTLQEKAVPAYRSGILLHFPVERARGALLTVVLENGEPLPVGASVTIADHEGSFPTGVRGEVYIDRLADLNRLTARWPGGTCEFDVAYTPSDDPLPLLGPYECRRVDR